MAQIIKLEYEEQVGRHGLEYGYCAVWDREPSDEELETAKKENPKILTNRWQK